MSSISTSTVEAPASEVLVTSLIWFICCTAVSTLSVTSSATSIGVAPGYWVRIWAFLIVNSGSSRRPSLV